MSFELSFQSLSFHVTITKNCRFCPTISFRCSRFKFFPPDKSKSQGVEMAEANAKKMTDGEQEKLDMELEVSLKKSLNLNDDSRLVLVPSSIHVDMKLNSHLKHQPYPWPQSSRSMTTELSCICGSQFSLSPRDLTQLIGTLLDQAEMTGKPEKATNLLKQLAGINGETFSSYLREAFMTFLEKNDVSRKNVGVVVSDVMKGMLEVRAALSEVVMEVLTWWVVEDTSRLSLHSPEGQTALQLLQRPEICWLLETSATLSYSTLHQELRKGLIYPSTSINSDAREAMLEMLLLMNENFCKDQLESERPSVIGQEVGPLAMEDPVKNLLPRLLTYSMVSSLGENEEEEDIESDQIDALESFKEDANVGDKYQDTVDNDVSTVEYEYEEIISNASGEDKHQGSDASVKVE